MSVKLKLHQLNIVNQVAKRMGFESLDLQTSEGSNKGDNYMADILTVRVTDRKTGKVANLILKCATADETIREVIFVNLVYTRETYIYKEVFPEIKKLQQQKRITAPFIGYPEYYGSNTRDKEETIVLRNLKEHGYRLWDSKKPLDEDHIVLVISEYAKFHAASMALKHLQPDKFEEFKPNVYSIFHLSRFPDKLRGMYEGVLNALLDTVQDNPKIRQRIETFYKNYSDFFNSLEEHEITINHGDCWTNNMLFQYEDSKPAKVCFLDFQISRLGTPVNDLTNFFCISVPQDSFPRYKLYLKTYHEVLSRNLQEFGLNPNEIYSFEELLSQWTKYMKHGLFLATTIFKLLICETDNLPDFSDITENETLVDKVVLDEQKNEAYKKRLIGLAEFMIQNEFL